MYLHIGMQVRQSHYKFKKFLRDSMMELYLQFGYGMMEHCRSLLSLWRGGTVVLSPRDLSADQLQRLASSVNSLPNTNILLDPQFYLPHADHQRLCSHEYWPNDYDTGLFWQGPQLVRLLTNLRDLNTRLQCESFILPGILALSINDDWLEMQRAILEEAIALRLDRPIILTLALSAEAVRDQQQVELLLDHAERWKPNGYYLVCEHPKGQYLVDDANWLANVLDIIAGLKLLGAQVILGYCNQQMLIAGVTKVNAIASGTWMNVRSFPPEKFNAVYDEEMKQRTTWYYCPQTLSEYKIPFLDIALRMGLLNMMSPAVNENAPFANALFSGVQPSSVGFNEQSAFRHYLCYLRQQSLATVRSTFDETVTAHTELLDTAQTLLQTLTASGIRGQLRDFTPIIDVNRAALELIIRLRGAMLRRRWPSLT